MMNYKIFKIYKLLNKTEKVKFNLLIFFTVITFFIEYISLISLPILAGFISENYELINKISKYFFVNISEVKNNNNLVLYVAIFTVSVFFLKNIFIIILNIYQFKFFKNLKVQLGLKLFSNYINEPYLNQISRNPSEIVRDVADELDNFLSYYSNLFIMLREILAIISIFLLLIFINFYIILSVIFFLGLISIIYFKNIKPLIKNKSKDNQIFRSKIIQHLNETNGLIKEIKILGLENNFTNFFRNVKNLYEKNLLLFEIVQRLPKNFLEIIVISYLVILSFIFMILLDDKNFLFTLLPILLVSFLRFIPAFNGISTIITYLKIYKPSVELIFKKIDSNLEIFNKNIDNRRTEKALKLNLNINNFQNYIYLDNLSFIYPKNKKTVFKNLSTQIKKGSRFGIVGASGSGKTTLFNIMLGLLKPSQGNVFFKDISIFKNLKIWRQKIGYVSQNIYLLDTSIKNNITLNISGNKNVNHDQLVKAIEIANLSQKVNSLPEGLETKVGNDGVNLSGGEKQRIALARAIYCNPEIFFLDEPTSALDDKTENIIMSNLINKYKDKTIISIAHRKSTIDRCDTVFDLNKFKV